MKKMKSALILGTLVAALGASTVFAATSTGTSDYDQNPHKMRNLVQQSIQERNAGNDSTGKIQYPDQGPGMGGCHKQGQMHKGPGGQHMGPGGMHKGPGIMREQSAKILADLTGRDAESIKEEARTNHKPIREMAKDAGVYDQFMAKHQELAKDHLDKAVADGKMSQDQADKMLQNMKDGKHFGPMGMGGKHMGLGHGMMQAENAKILADLTGRDVESIKEDSRTNHKPIREMAKDAGVYDQFMAKHLELAKGHLDKAVADGKMSQEQADKILQNIKEGKHQGPKDGMHKHMMQGPRNGDCQNND
ncbi:MAG: hypothetical protein AB9883_04180 [Acidaminococcaceae bacterium]